jgi:diguanylate cyclase (GGDEF)-like protein
METKGKNRDLKKIVNDMYEKESLILNEIKNSFSKEDLSKECLNSELSIMIKSYEKLLKLIKKLTKVGDANQRKLILAYNEIDKQKKELDDAYKKLDLLSRVDPLTNLSNRRDFLEKVEYEKIRFERENKKFAFILSDIDNFKIFNDKYGHDCGDFVLKKVAEVFTKSVRQQDAVGRWGGEEFILLLPNVLQDGAIKIAEKLRVAISEKIYKYKTLELSISMTFGVSVYDETTSVDSCIKRADEGLYKGKLKGKNCVVYKE